MLALAFSALWSVLLALLLLLSLEGGVWASVQQSFALSSIQLNESQHDRIPMEHCKTVAYSRIDPIVDLGNVSSHVHIVVGGSAFGPELPYEAATSSSCTTMPITSDKSSYWQPNMYYEWENRTWSALQGVTNITYFLRPPSVDNPSLQEFPAGFAMLGGSQYRWNRSRPVMDDLIWYECTPSDGGSVSASWTLPDQNCSTVTTVVTFPWCWTGKELRTGGKNNHVAYPNGTGDDWVNCNDPTYPIRLPRIEHRVSYDLTHSPSRPNSLALSNGDKTGYSLHADFLNGWPKGYLVDVFATRSACRASLASGGNDSACSVGLKNTDINAAAACEQPLSSSLVVNEQTGLVGTVDRPPGCTPEEMLVGINPLCSSPDFRKLPVPDLVTPVDHFGGAQFPISPADQEAFSVDSGGASNVAIIVPSVVGGVLVVAFVCGFVFWALRRRRLRRHRTLTDDVVDSSASGASRDKVDNGSINGTARPSLVTASSVGTSREGGGQMNQVSSPPVGTPGSPSSVSSGGVGGGGTMYSDAPTFDTTWSQSTGFTPLPTIANPTDYSRGLSAINEGHTAVGEESYESPSTSVDSPQSQSQRSLYGPVQTQALWGSGGTGQGNAGGGGGGGSGSAGGGVSQETSYVGQDGRVLRNVVTVAGR